MKDVAEYMSSSLRHALPAGQQLVNIASTDRFAMYKVGPVLAVSVRLHCILFTSEYIAVDESPVKM